MVTDTVDRYCHFSIAKFCPTLLPPSWTVAHQAPPSMGFPRQEYWSRLPFLLPRKSPPRDQTHISCTGRRVLYHRATRTENKRDGKLICLLASSTNVANFQHDFVDLQFLSTSCCLFIFCLACTNRIGMYTGLIAIGFRTRSPKIQHPCREYFKLKEFEERVEAGRAPVHSTHLPLNRS